MKIFDYAISEITSKQGYSALFKAFIVIATLYLVSIIQVTKITLPIVADSYKLKYEVEQELKKEVAFSDLTCTFEMKSYQQCKLALYKNDIADKSLIALVSFQDLLKILAYITGVFAVIGFIFHPYVHKKKT
ncbi:hypothetical protein OM427_22190 [Halomonas sp. 18H]|nr:hypothetical protein [Halomonas sp. 18H]MCW4152235.1 hypothetical protein [Halomonas sp. 18H]